MLFTSGTIAGLSRADGTTSRTISMVRTGNLKNGFTAREVSAHPNAAQSLVHTTFEQRGPSGKMIRHQATEWTWNYQDPTAADPSALAGRVLLNRNGLHIPVDCPDNVRKDIRQQLSAMANNSAGSLGLYLVYNPVLIQDFAF